MEPYAPRDIRFQCLRTPGDWALKLYSVAYGDAAVDWAGFEPALRLAEGELPLPNDDQGRPGLGFLIAHQGRTGDYLVVCWWDRENELPIRVWVRRRRDEAWRAGRDGESICVWDLEVIWSERQAWVETMMGQGGPDRADYLKRIDPSFLAKA